MSSSSVTGASALPHSNSAASLGKRAGRKRRFELPDTPSIVPGLALAVALALCATLIGRWLPALGAAVSGILLGMVVRNVRGVNAVFYPGLQYGSSKVLQGSIVLLGFGLSLQQVAQTGASSLLGIAVTIVVAFGSVLLLGKWMGTPARLTTMIGAGTAICGGTAIAAITPIIKAKEHETAYAISTIFIFNVVAVLTFPWLGHWLGMSDTAFGMWAGTAINDTSSTVAAAYTYSQAAGDYATIVKLTRATLIIPLCIGLIAFQIWRNKKEGTQKLDLARIFPWFILWFLAASALRSGGLVPEVLDTPLRVAAQFMIVVALTSVGLSSDLRTMAKTGIKPVLMGMGAWLSVVTASLVVLALLGFW